MKHGGEVLSAAFDPVGQRLATTSSDFAVRIWSVETGLLDQTLIGHAWAVRSVSLSSDGRRLLTVSEDGTARIWDTASCSASHIFDHGGVVYDACFASGDEQIYTVSQDGYGFWQMRKYGLANFEERGEFRIEREINHARFSSNDRMLIVATDAGDLHLWNLESGKRWKK